MLTLDRYTMNRICADDLRQVTLFAGLTDEELLWLADWLDGRSSEVRLQAGEVLYREGSAAESFYILIEGELQTSKYVDGSEMALGRQGAGEVVGEMALLRGTPYQDTAQ